VFYEVEVWRDMVTYQVIPSHPIAKNELNTNRKTAAVIPRPVLGFTGLVVAAKTAIAIAWPAAPKSMRLRRPNFSIVKMAIQDAMKYSVPLQAASNRLRKGESPMFCSKIVAA
jgi:hypothetical protein